MDILYIVGTGSPFNNDELRYSLRSISANGSNISKVYVVGNLPEFINTNAVTFIRASDPYNSKHQNIMYKIDQAITESDIGEKFLISSDDHFYINPVDFDNYPIYYTGRLPSKPVTNKNNRGYFKSIVDTKAVLISNGWTTFATNPHCNTLVTRSAWKAIERFRTAALLFDHGLEMNCILGNYYHSVLGMELIRIQDIKVGEITDESDLLSKIKYADCFSISDTAWSMGVKSLLMSRFPNKCKYEL